MFKILFVCHGNICRSPMAEYIFRDMLKKRGVTDVVVSSAGTSSEELGNPVHRGTAGILNRLGIEFSDKRARRMTQKDYDDFDLLIGMDTENIRNMERFWNDKKHKIHRLLEYAGGGDISDPWYTGDFERTYRDIKKGCEGLLEYLATHTEY